MTSFQSNSALFDGEDLSQQDSSSLTTSSTGDTKHEGASLTPPCRWILTGSIDDDSKQTALLAEAAGVDINIRTKPPQKLHVNPPLDCRPKTKPSQEPDVNPHLDCTSQEPDVNPPLVCRPQTKPPQKLYVNPALDCRPKTKPPQEPHVNPPLDCRPKTKPSQEPDVNPPLDCRPKTKPPQEPHVNPPLDCRAKVFPGTSKSASTAPDSESKGTKTTKVTLSFECDGPPSTNLLNFISLHNGYLTNREQFTVEDRLSGEHHDYAAFDFTPVQVPAFPESTVFFFEETVNGLDWRIQLRVVREDENGIIKVQPYNLTYDPSTHRFGSYDLTKLQDLKPEDFKKQVECEAQFKVIEPTVFLGTWPICQLREAGQDPPVHIALLTCSGVSGFTTKKSFERWSRIPYTLRAVERYELPSYMLRGRTDWTNPCDD